VAFDLLDHAPCGFISFGDDGKIRYINATLLKRLGFEPGSLDDKHVETILAVGSRIFYQTHFFPLVKLHGRAEEIFLLLRANDGESVGMLWNAVRHERNGGPVTDCVLMEVRQRREFEEALLEARQMAEETNRAKSNFLAVMSHELRTPLNAIGGYVQLLEMGVHGPVSDAQLETLARINRSQKHLLRLINDVLNLARIEAGRVDYEIKPILVADIVASVMPMVEPQIARKSLEFSADVPASLSTRADMEKAQQILLNLLTNAIKFTASSGTVRIEAGSRSRSEIYMRVVDTGTGIPEDMLEKVFEPFTQVGHSHSAEGTGLGLAISRDLARGMGGDLVASSILGKGSSFEVILPSA